MKIVLHFVTEFDNLAVKMSLFNIAKHTPGVTGLRGLSGFGLLC